MSRRFETILETIGNTPVVRLNRIAPDNVNLYVKIESFNPMGSIKDRLALGIIEEAERCGELQPGQTVIEATSGNTGIGLAMVCAHKGYPLVVTMAENFSIERRKMMRFLGARVVLTPAAAKGSGMLAKARELARKHGWFLCRQFENEANADIHSRTTAAEILAAFAGETLDYWVTGYGTGGTLKGVARVLRRQSPATRVVVCEPDNANLLGSGIDQPQSASGGIIPSHPHFRPHLMQGWTPDFISPLTADTVAMGLIDEIVPIDGNEALRCAQALAREEGIFAGISAGATLAGALAVASRAAPGATILCMLPDTGERYLSTPLFAAIEADMCPEEMALSNSTPNFRFGVVQPTAPAHQIQPQPEQDAGGEAEEFVQRLLADSEKPVIMFALEWCEFCWSVRRFFTHCGIPFEAIDLDSSAYQKADLGGRIRTALQARSGCQTIPQIFVGGEFIGGCTEVFDAWNCGELAARLRNCGLSFRADISINASSFLPGWLQSR